MIEIKNVSKHFGDSYALDEVTCNIPKGCIYGMVGSNGAGKSTFLRLACGIYKPDNGNLLINGEDVFENPNVKQKIVFVSDDLYFISGASLNRMAKTYRRFYPAFDDERFKKMTEYFNLNPDKPISSFSKGMKRQAAIILALSAKPDYLFLDETFDGLDPVMRKFVKSLIYDDVATREMTTILTSHSLRELEDICDSLVLLHKGKIILENNINELKASAYKIQVAFDYDYDQSLFNELTVESFSKQGSVSNIIIKGDIEETKKFFENKKPVLFEILPLTLEELFTHKMKEFGYDFSDVLNKLSENEEKGEYNEK